MQVIKVPPKRYFLVTACSLTPGNKDTTLQAMQPFMCATADIYGADDLDALLDQYPVIYRKHHRLWLHSIEQPEPSPLRPFRRGARAVVGRGENLRSVQRQTNHC